MAGLSIDTLSKSFGAFRALDRVSLNVRDGEFIAILGPSGCGKTTLLRQIAGFDKADDGRITIGDTTVTAPGRHVPPERRRIGIVFQSYALWPHMSVAQNVAYGLDVVGVREPERSRRVREALSLVALEGFDDHRPAMLSGGQRQRVALARCLVTEPSLVLLDEPLANLDVHLRASMEREFASFHERTGTTMLYITHDQAEAMALADRVAVMEKGRILQVATPSQLYREPADEMVARFIGEGMVVPVRVLDTDAGTCTVDVFGSVMRMRCMPGQRAHTSGSACLRPGELRVAEPDKGLPAIITRAVYRGGRYRVELALKAAPATPLHAVVPEAFAPQPGRAVGVTIMEGWVLPAPAAS